MDWQFGVKCASPADLNASDLEFLDKIPLGAEEIHGWSGRHKT